MIKNWLRIKDRVLSETRIFTLMEVLDRSPYNAREHTFCVIDSPDWVNLVPVTERAEGLTAVVLISPFVVPSPSRSLESFGVVLNLPALTGVFRVVLNSPVLAGCA